MIIMVIPIASLVSVMLKDLSAPLVKMENVLANLTSLEINVTKLNQDTMTSLIQKVISKSVILTKNLIMVFESRM